LGRWSYLLLGFALIALVVFGVFIASKPKGRSVTVESGEVVQNLRIDEIVPRDAIPAILNPRFTTASEAVNRGQMAPSELVIGLTINGESKAYSVMMLSRHEIVNDVVGGVPVAVTW
jgi:uncharacterized protein (DUF58 family)